MAVHSIVSLLPIAIILFSPMFLLLAAVGYIVRDSLIIVVAIVFAVRYFALRNRASFGFTIMIGAVVSLGLPLLEFLYSLVRYGGYEFAQLSEMENPRFGAYVFALFIVGYVAAG